MSSNNVTSKGLMTKPHMLMVHCLPIVFSYFINLRTMLPILKILPATHSNDKQNIQFQNKIDW